MADYAAWMSFILPVGTKARWQEIAREQGISLSELIRGATNAERLAEMYAQP